MTALYRVRDWFSKYIILIIGLGVLLYLFLPVGVVMLMSFNAQKARNSYTFDGFTLANWQNICADPTLCDSVGVSLEIAGLATLVATALGTLMAFAMVRHRFRGRSVANIVIFLPMATPEVVMGSSLLALFINAELLGSPQTTMIGLIIQKLFLAFNLPAASALSVILMVSIVVLVAVYVWRAGTEELV